MTDYDLQKAILIAYELTTKTYEASKLYEPFRRHLVELLQVQLLRAKENLLVS